MINPLTKEKFFSDKEFYKTMFNIAIPISIQNVISSSLNMVDTIMIGSLGATCVASVGIANRLFFILILLLFGISTGATVFTSQYWGKKDIPNIRKVLGMALSSSLFVGFIMMVVMLTIPHLVMSIFTKDSEIIKYGSLFLKINSISFVFTSITFTYAFICRSTGNTKLPMFITIFCLGINTLLNYCLIFGNFGFPQMGVAGAAISTNIARFFECFFLILLIYLNNYPAAAKIREMRFDFSFFKNFLKTTMPIISNEFFWVIGITIYSIIYARMGTNEIAAISIISPIESIAIGIFFGLANACSIMLGNQLGINNNSKADKYAKRFIRLGLVFSIFFGILLIIFADKILSFYKVDKVIIDLSKNILIILCIFLWIKIFNMITIVGILRSGGDVKFSLFMDTGAVWVFGVPLVFIAAFILKLPLPLVYLLSMFEEVVKGCLGIFRIYSKKWIKNLVG
ncbi:MAG: hypothetical protein A2086_06120 [Spirochaetes bacterium GWD1_27_9]|nr:MAG: hypothetical protein A2Z98_16775 [Spirochaetes bacterium GWB1_27_13]OHD27831.1 MAG: hypothetical protein A2Y34_15515 [Spirochaetes bacterium GWC1_27_15]OHD30844.1 MAG: hypothetical protein A2086_06120 [Spirochaetes bacterium GWD1_27_9]